MAYRAFLALPRLGDSGKQAHNLNDVLVNSSQLLSNGIAERFQTVWNKLFPSNHPASAARYRFRSRYQCCCELHLPLIVTTPLLVQNYSQRDAFYVVLFSDGLCLRKQTCPCMT